MQLDKDFILEELKDYQDYILKHYGVKIVGLFGSFSKDKAHDKSDIDLLYEIEKNSTLSLFKLLKLTAFLEDLLGKKVDLVRKQALKPKLQDIITKELIYV